MRWNQLANDIPRATALADIMCGAATADGTVDEAELVVVDAMLMKVLGVAELPADLKAHVRAFNRKRFDLEAALLKLSLSTDKEKKALVQVVTDIVEADTKVTKGEKTFVKRLGSLLTPDA